MSEIGLLERHLPRFDFAERHHRRVDAAPATIWKAVEALDLGGSPIVRLLFRLRGLPRSSLRLDGLEKMGFIPLGVREGSELALGVVGKFWTPGGHLQRLDAAEFDDFCRPGFAKAVWNFSLEPLSQDVTRVATETRILCLDAASCRRFAPYWLLVRPFSAWTRREALRVIARQAEAPNR